MRKMKIEWEAQSDDVDRVSHTIYDTNVRVSEKGGYVSMDVQIPDDGCLHIEGYTPRDGVWTLKVELPPNWGLVCFSNFVGCLDSLQKV